MNKPELDQEAKLNQRLSVIKKYYDLDALLAHGTKQQDIAKYYRRSDFSIITSTLAAVAISTWQFQAIKPSIEPIS